MVVVLLLKIAILMHFGAKNRTDPGGTDVRDFTNVPPSTKLPLAASPAFGPFNVPVLKENKKQNISSEKEH